MDETNDIEYLLVVFLFLLWPSSYDRLVPRRRLSNANGCAYYTKNTELYIKHTKEYKNDSGVSLELFCACTFSFILLLRVYFA